MLVSAQSGIFAVSSVYATSKKTGKRSKSRCANTVPTSVADVPLPVRETPAQDGDARDLPCTRRNDRVREQADTERREHDPVAGVRLGQGLVDDEVPCDRARETEARLIMTARRSTAT